MNAGRWLGPAGGAAVLLGWFAGTAVALDPLPEGPGLAARYPGDEGIARDPAVLFADDFESVRGPKLRDGVHQDGKPEDWNHRWDQAWGGSAVTAKRGAAHAGRQALEIFLPPGEAPRGKGLSKHLPPGHDRVFYRYYVKYARDFPGGHHAGGAIEARAPGVPHANPGFKADGKNKITVLLDHWSFEPGMVPPGPQVAYIYHLDQQHEWGEQFYPSGKIQPGTNMHLKLLGPEFVPRADFTPPRGTWLCAELMVQANAPEARDGRVAFWIDGRLAADFPNLKFRTVDSLTLNRVDVGLYESRRNGPHRIWFDDVVVATSYIGPRTK